MRAANWRRARDGGTFNGCGIETEFAEFSVPSSGCYVGKASTSQSSFTRSRGEWEDVGHVNYRFRLRKTTPGKVVMVQRTRSKSHARSVTNPQSCFVQKNEGGLCIKRYEYKKYKKAGKTLLKNDKATLSMISLDLEKIV